LTTKDEPMDPLIKLPCLIWGKTICIQMMGNDIWKHERDYKAIPTMTKKWLYYQPPCMVELKEILEKIEDYMAEHENDIDWILLEKLRVICHDYLREVMGGKYNPDPDGIGVIMVPEQWIISGIRELTNS